MVVHAPRSLAGMDSLIIGVAGGYQGRHVLSIPLSLVFCVTCLPIAGILHGPSSFDGLRVVRGWGLDQSGP